MSDPNEYTLDMPCMHCDEIMSVIFRDALRDPNVTCPHCGKAFKIDLFAWNRQRQFFQRALEKEFGIKPKK